MAMARSAMLLAFVAGLLLQPLALPLHLRTDHTAQAASCLATNSHPAPVAPSHHTDSRSCDICQWLLQVGQHLLVESAAPQILESLGMPVAMTIAPSPVQVESHHIQSPRAPPSIA